MNLRAVIMGLAVIALTTPVFSGCDKLSEFLPKSEQSSTSQAPETEVASYAASQLSWQLDALDNQVERILRERGSGDQQQIRTLMDNFFRMEEAFRNDLERLSGELSSGESIELSRRHRDIVRRL